MRKTVEADSGARASGSTRGFALLQQTVPETETTRIPHRKGASSDPRGRSLPGGPEAGSEVCPALAWAPHLPSLILTRMGRGRACQPLQG